MHTVTLLHDGRHSGRLGDVPAARPGGALVRAGWAQLGGTGRWPGRRACGWSWGSRPSRGSSSATRRRSSSSSTRWAARSTGFPLRGYDEFSITPQGFNPLATSGATVSPGSFGNSFFAATVEFGARFSQSVYADVFYDVGNVYATAAAFNPTRLFRGAGIGVALVTPLGPIGLDLGLRLRQGQRLGAAGPGLESPLQDGQRLPVIHPWTQRGE